MARTRLAQGIWLAPLALILAGVSLYAAGEIPSPPGNLVSILSGELTREFDVLKTKGDPAALPYYMAYEVTDQENDAESASLGALVNNIHNHERGVDTTIRIGNPKFDNYHPFKGQPIRFTVNTALSLDDDANQIRRVLWSESDRVYKLGSRRLLQLKTDNQLVAEQSETNADFSTEPAATYAKLPETYRFDGAAWADKLRTWSAEFKSHPQIVASNVSYRASRETRTFVNTEGSAIQLGSNLFRLEIQGGAIAQDGMQLQTFTSIEASEPGHLPADSVVRTRVRELADKLDALVKAPPAEPIVCPAILSGRASAVFFHEIFGHRVEGHRQKDISEGQTFTKMLGTKVLPSFISVDFDATRTNYQGADLIGHYEYDDEGVKARPVKVVEDGVLKTFLLSRSPVGEFVQSNGHGRRQPGFE
ncbi:MAG TPA: metallopeptidase TldD-related protein, partial [Bryobacteraceae bacterium]|nr:metallopeptidase TldD-related protein [Bryobacteraceae bacterium]